MATIAGDGVIAHLLRVLNSLRSPTDLAGASTTGPQTAGTDQDEAPANDGDTTSLGALTEVLDERAFGLMFLLLALPCCLPFIYVLPQIVAVPMLFLGIQMASGREAPWLPRRFRERRVSIPEFETVLRRSARYIGWVERFAHARLLVITSPIGCRIIGALMLIPCASILLPIPSTNTVPGIGVAIISIGMIERDGLLIIGGLLIGLFWVGLLIFFGAEGIALLKGWLSGLF